MILKFLYSYEKVEVGIPCSHGKKFSETTKTGSQAIPKK